MGKLLMLGSPFWCLGHYFPLLMASRLFSHLYASANLKKVVSESKHNVVFLVFVLYENSIEEYIYIFFKCVYILFFSQHNNVQPTNQSTPLSQQSNQRKQDKKWWKCSHHSWWFWKKVFCIFLGNLGCTFE